MKRLTTLFLTFVLLFSSLCIGANAENDDYFATREYWEQRGCVIIDNVAYQKNKKSYTAVEFFTTDEAGNYIKKLVVVDKINSLPVTEIEFDDVDEDGYYRDIKDLTKIQRIVLPDSIKRINYSSFEYFKSVKKLNIPKSLKYIGDEAFDRVKSLKKLSLPDTVNHIGTRAFMAMDSLEKFTFPSKIKNIPYGVLQECDNLSEVKFKGKVKTIGPCAFTGCKSLKSITIPKTVKEIDNEAFAHCRKLSKVVIKGYKIPDIKKSVFYRTKKGVRFQVRNKTLAKELKAELKKSGGVKKAKIYVGDKLIYKNITYK